MAASSLPDTAAVLSGRAWQYRDGFLLNEFVGRVGHTPSWIVEVEGRFFSLREPSGFWSRILAPFRKPRIVMRNRRRLAFAWPLRWPPPSAEQREQLVDQALAVAGGLGATLDSGCGVCEREWNGGPTFMKGRARHICPDCAERIADEIGTRPPGVVSTWMWCLVAGIGGLLLQLLLHQSWSWTAAPAALVTGWLMGLANGPNFERRPWLAPIITVSLVIVLQAVGLALITGSRIGASTPGQLATVFIWTMGAMPPNLILGIVAGALGISMGLLERRLQRA